MDSLNRSQARRRVAEGLEEEALLERGEENGRPGGHLHAGSQTANIALLCFLYTLQGVPLGLAAAMPMMLQNKGVLYKDQAMFSLVNWPFSIKLLWAPVVDAVFSERFGRRKTWLVPTQYMIGLFMLGLSYRVDHWVTDPAGPHIVLLTVLFFLLNFLAATQDIAVDGWALTMLSRESVGLASTCNSVGQTAGYFVGYVVFIALESADFCNSYLRSAPMPHGVVTLPSFLSMCGLVFLVTTTLVAIFKKEARSRAIDEASLNVRDTYLQLLSIMRLPSMRTLALVFLTVKVGFCATDSVSGLKLVAEGVPREKFAMVAVFLLPLQLVLPLLLSKFLVGTAPMDVYTRTYPFRLAFNFVAAVFVWATPYMITKDSVPFHYYLLLVGIFSIHQVTLYSMFVAQMAFFARISDPAVGGTYMTLLNTLCNLGSAWPNTLVLLFVDSLTFKSCSADGDNNCVGPAEAEACAAKGGECETWLDGYYPLVALCTAFGLVWMGWGRQQIRWLQRRDPSAWAVSARSR